MSKIITCQNVVSTFRLVESSAGLLLDLEEVASRLSAWILAKEEEEEKKNATSIKYNPKKFCALIFKQKVAGSNVTALIFASFRIVLCGARSVGESWRCALELARLLRSLGVCPQKRLSALDFKVQNIVGSMKMGNNGKKEEEIPEKQKCATKINLSQLYDHICLLLTAGKNQKEEEYEEMPMEKKKNMQLRRHANGYVIWEPELYGGLRFFLPQSASESPNVVALIFSSGSIIITGARTERELMLSSDFIVNLLDTI